MSGTPNRGSFRLAGARVQFGSHQVLSDIDLEIDASEAVAVVGPSGAGKSTFLHLLNGTVYPAQGSVCVDGKDLRALTPRELRGLRSRIGFIHQAHNLVPNLRVIQNVVAGKLGQRGFFSSARSMIRPSRMDQLRVHALLDRVGISEKLFERTDTLSGGQLQRVAIARALFQEPQALLADEPVASVDPARARDLIQLMRDLAREDGLTLIVCLHDLSLAREFFPRTIGLRNGRLAFDLPTDQVPDDSFRDLYRLETT